jgi:hypothetical protein
MNFSIIDNEAVWKLEEVMNRCFIVISAIAVFSSSAFCVNEARNCRTGKLLDVQQSKSMVPTTSTEHVEKKNKKNGKTEYDTFSTPGMEERTTFTVTVALGDMTYTGESNYIGFGFKPTVFIVNDPVRACVDGKKLVIIRPDGKDYKSNIVQAVRNSQPAEPAGAPAAGGAAAAAAPDNSSKARLQVTSTPPGADIEVDGAFVGSTPSSLELTTGDHNVVIVKNGYKQWTRTIRITGGDISIAADLQH